MTRFARTALLPLLAVALTAGTAAGTARADASPWPTPDASWSETDWAAFSENLVVALATDNDGLQQSALQMIVRYGDRLDVRDAAFDVIRMFRDHRDPRVRRLAAVACTQLGSGWALGFLRMAEPFERDARVRATLQSIARADALLAKDG